jgi:exosortase
MRVQGVFATALIVLLLVVLTWPAPAWLWQEWQHNDAYSHGPLILLVSAFFAWRWARHGTVQPATPASWRQRVLCPALEVVLCSLGVVLWTTAIHAFPLTLLASIPLILGMLWYLLGAAGARELAFPVGYLAFAVPVPLAEQWSVPLQQWTASVSTALARLLGIPATHEGSKVMLTTCDLSIGAPCSGLHSLAALLALAALMAHILQGRWWARTMLLVLAVPIALLANTGRVLALLLVAERWGRGVALGLWHHGSGLAFFGLALGLLIALSWGLGCRNVRADI